MFYLSSLVHGLIIPDAVFGIKGRDDWGEKLWQMYGRTRGENTCSRAVMAPARASSMALYRVFGDAPKLWLRARAKITARSLLVVL